MKKISIIWLVLLFLFIVACKSDSSEKSSLKKGSEISGKVIAIIDGDTYDVLIHDNKTIRIRMEGIDAPERGMPFFRKSKDYLAKLCFNKNIHIKITGKDRYNRYLAYTFLNDTTELSSEMIKAGLAWHYKEYNADTVLASLELEARNLKKGLWIYDNPMPPWTNRNYHRQGISTKDSFNIKEDEK